MPTGLDMVMEYWSCAAGKPFERCDAREEGAGKGRKALRNISAPMRARKIEWLQTLCGSSRGRARMRNAFRIPKRTTAFLAVVVVSVLGLYGIPARGQMAGVTLYISGDTNIQEMFDKDLLPLFERETSVKTKMVFLEHGQGAESILAKIIAAKRTGQQTDVDLYQTQPTIIAQGSSEGIWTRTTKDNME